MSTQRGNIKKSGPPKHQNKKAWKNVYHDTSIQTKRIVNTEVSGVCKRCKDIIDWKISYKKYKPLSQPKTCVTCKQRNVRKAYNVYCEDCSSKDNKCAKCGEKKDIVLEPSLPEALQAAEDSRIKLKLEMLSERKRRTYLRLIEKGELKPGMFPDSSGEEDSETDSEDECKVEQNVGTEKSIVEKVKCMDLKENDCHEKDTTRVDLNKD